MLQNVTDSERTVIDARMVMAAEMLANPDFVALVNSLVSQYADAELAMVWKSLCKRIQNGDMQAIRLYFELRERGLTMKQKEQEEKPVSRLYETLGAEGETNYETVTEAETGAEMGAPSEVSE